MRKSKKNGRGALSDTKRGTKPAVAHESERQARENIERKLELLLKAIKKAQASGSRLAEDYPSSRTQFNSWQPSLASGVALATNANDTLKRHSDLLLAVDDASKLAKVLKSEDQSSMPSREERLASARRAQRMHWTLRTIAERSAIAARREVAALRQSLVVRDALMKSAEDEFGRLLGELRKENEMLRAENSKLVREIGKIVPLHRKK